MKKFFKTVFRLSVFAAISYFGYKFYQKIMSIINISKTLPQYLDNLVGEHPKVDLTLTLKSGRIKIGFSQETLDKNENLEEIIREYITDFYPALNSQRMEIELFAKTETKKAEEQKENEEEIEEEIEEEQVKETPIEDNEDSDFDTALEEEK